MADIFSSLSDAAAAAVEHASRAVVQVDGRRPAAGVVFGRDLILAPAHIVDNDVASIRTHDGAIHEARCSDEPAPSGSRPCV
jgi:hypothetical protein